MSDIGKILGEAYRSRYEMLFKHHPKRDEIIPKLVAGGNSVEQVDLWFAEAENYNWDYMSNKIKNAPVNADGTITFKVVRD